MCVHTSRATYHGASVRTCSAPETFSRVLSLCAVFFLIFGRVEGKVGGRKFWVRWINGWEVTYSFGLGKFGDGN